MTGYYGRKALVGKALDADEREAGRYLDLQIDVMRYKSGTPIARFGGRWDRLRKDYAGDASRSRVIEVHAAQVEAIELFNRWLDDHLRGTPTELSHRVREIIEGDLELDEQTGAFLGISELFLTGGRRSGKTLVMELLLNAYAIAVPDAVVWTITPSEGFHEEPREVIKSIMPREWYRYRPDPHWRFELANGSQHVLRSGHNPGALKKGRADLVGLNEAQQIPEATYRNARGAVVDSGAFTIVAANPPTTGDIGMWVLDVVTKITKHERPAAQHLFLDPLDNPHIDQRKLLAMRAGMTEHDWQTQIRGRMLQLPDRVLYTWDRGLNERPAPDFGRITREFLTAHEGDRAEWDHAVVVDVQGYPWVATGVFAFYRDPRDPKNPKAALAWMVDEVALAQGDEVDVCDELKRRGYRGDRTLVIMDASCEWQQMARDLTKQRPDYRGKGSADMFRRCGFKHVVPPDRHSRRNPEIFERVKAANATIRPADDVPGLFIDPEKCPNAIESVRSWRMVRNKPSRNQRAAHFGDVVSYLVWRYWPRRGNARKLLESEALHVDHPTRDSLEGL